MRAKTDCNSWKSHTLDKFEQSNYYTVTTRTSLDNLFAETRAVELNDRGISGEKSFRLLIERSNIN